MIEIDSDGYPTEESLAQLRAEPWEMKSAAAFMIEEFPHICGAMLYPSVEVTDGKEAHFGNPVKRIEFSTGGWSGAEDLIGEMLAIFWFKHLQVSWRRGGHYVFEVPLKLFEESEK